MFVVDGIELVAVQHVADIRHFDHRDAGRLEDGTDARDEAVEIRHVREHVVGVERVRQNPLLRQLPGERHGEESLARRDTGLARVSRDVAGRLDPEHGHVAAR